MNGVRITGIGSCLPATSISNADLTQLVDTSDDWVVSRTGIRNRRVVSGDESVASLAIEAAQGALAFAGVSGADVDLIVVATSTADTIYPAVSCQIQHAIGASKAAGFDMALACTGFVYALVTAQQFIKTGMAKTALVVASDIHSRVTDWTDRNTCVLFGDGAGAFLLQADPTQDDILAADLRVDGSKGQLLTLSSNLENCPLVTPRSPQSPYVYMNGREVFKFAVGTVPVSIRTSLERAGMTIEDIDFLVLHQANLRIMSAMAEKLGLPEEKLLIGMEDYGNTSAASIPIAMMDAVRDGRIQPGQKLVLCGYGAGLAWASAVLQWNLSAPAGMPGVSEPVAVSASR